MPRFAGLFYWRNNVERAAGFSPKGRNSRAIKGAVAAGLEVAASISTLKLVIPPALLDRADEVIE